MKWMSEPNDKNNTTTYANCYTNNGQCKNSKYVVKYVYCILFAKYKIIT